MSRHTFTRSAPSPDGLTPEQVERVRTALRATAGELLELGAEELEERIVPGFAGTN
jgi:hypothetical protein